MIERAFDQYASKYDEWFLKNVNVLASEVALVAHFLANPGRSLSIGCGSGLFEAILKKEYNITITEGIEPAEGMAEIAMKRGLKVTIGTAEDTDFGTELYDTVMFNGTPSYITDLQKAVNKAYKALKPGGMILLIDVPKESSYGLLYNLAKEIGSWEHKYFQEAKAPNAYPISFINESNWRSTPEKTRMLKNAGFTDFEFAQTLTKHPAYSDEVAEKPIPGFDCGDYVAIKGIKTT